MKIFSILIISLLLSGCVYKVQNTIPQDLFKNKIILDKPIIENDSDVFKAYFNLFKAYNENLELIKLIENLNKNN